MGGGGSWREISGSWVKPYGKNEVRVREPLQQVQQQASCLSLCSLCGPQLVQDIQNGPKWERETTGMREGELPRVKVCVFRLKGVVAAPSKTNAKANMLTQRCELSEHWGQRDYFHFYYAAGVFCITNTEFCWALPVGPGKTVLPIQGAWVQGEGAKILHTSWPKNPNINQKQYCNKVNKDFKKWSTWKKIF